VFAWPPRDHKSRALKFVNWAVDPDELPILPGPIPLGAGDDPQAVETRDIQAQQYDALYQKGGWMTQHRVFAGASAFSSPHADPPEPPTGILH
jgi:hypothetical protein